MKKQKAANHTTESKTTADNDLAVLIDLRGNDGGWSKEQFIPVLAKIRQDIQWYFVAEPSTGVEEIPEIAGIVGRGKGVIGNEAEIRTAIESGKHNWYVVADQSNMDMLPQSIAFYGASKKSIESEGVYLGEPAPKAGKGSGIWQRIKYALYNFTGQLITPTPQKDFTVNYAYFSKDTMLNVLVPGELSSKALLARASYMEASFGSLKLSAKEITVRKISWGKIFSNAFTARWNWFVKDALTGKDFWRPAFLAMTVFALVSMLVMSQQFGMTWDEKRHNDYSKESLKYFESFGEDTTCLKEGLPTQEFRYYGEHFNVVAAFLYTHVLSIGEFETRHLLNAFYGFLAMLFAALLAKEIGSWRTGFIALLLIYLSPVFFGHSMNNPTDIPFAAGFAIAIYYFLKIYKTLPAPKFSHIFMAALGVGMAVGSRVGGILLYAYAGMFFGIHFLLQFKQNGFKNIAGYLKSFILLLVIGHLFSISLWPFGQQDIFTNWYVALKKSTEGAYFTYNHELFEGVRMYMANVPWYYLPKFIIINAPLVVLAGFALVLLLIIFWKKLFKKPILLAFVLFALIFPIFYAEYQSMYYYNGWRHYLFVYPSMIVLAALGWDALMRLINQKMVNTVVVVVIAGLSALPASWMYKNHPNECVYFNELEGGTKGAYGKYETDYYSNSCRAAGEWLANQEKGKKLIVAINNEPQTAAYYTAKINPDLEFRWVREYEEQKPFWDYEILTSRTFSAKEMMNGSFPPKGTVHVIEADGVPLAAIVKREDFNLPLGYKALETKQNDSALYYFTEATRLHDKEEEAWRMLGIAYMNKGEADTAISMIQKSIDLCPENYAAYNDMGLVYMNVKQDYGAAIAQFKKATELKFNFAESYYYIGSCYMNMKDFMTAATYLDYGIKRGGSGIPELYYNLGVCHLNLSNYKKAEENFINCLTLSPNFAMGYRALAEVFQKEGKTAEAQQCMERYRQLGGQ